MKILRFLCWILLFFIALLTVFLGNRIVENKNKMLRHLENKNQQAKNQKIMWQQSKLCSKENLENFLKDFLFQNQNFQNFQMAWHKKTKGDFLIDQTELKINVPLNVHWADFLNQLAQKIPAHTQFEQCVFDENARTLHCFVTFYRLSKCT